MNYPCRHQGGTANCPMSCWNVYGSRFVREPPPKITFSPEFIKACEDWNKTFVKAMTNMARNLNRALAKAKEESRAAQKSLDQAGTHLPGEQP